MPKDNIEKLRPFILDVEKDINLVVSNIAEINPALEESLLQLIADAWEEVTPRFADIYENLSEGAETLKKNGLDGTQLDLKLRVYKLLRENFNDVFKAFKEATGYTKKWMRGLIKSVTGRLFLFVDSILDSLGDIPGAHAVKEFKGVLEAIIAYL